MSSYSLDIVILVVHLNDIYYPRAARSELGTVFASSDRMHAKDPKNLAGVQTPGGNRLFIVLCV